MVLKKYQVSWPRMPLARLRHPRDTELSRHPLKPMREGTMPTALISIQGRT